MDYFKEGSSKKHDFKNPQIFCVEKKMFMFGANGFKGCYVGETDDKSGEINWKQFAEMPFVMYTYGRQLVVKVAKNKENPSFLRFGTQEFAKWI